MVPKVYTAGLEGTTRRGARLVTIERNKKRGRPKKTPILLFGKEVVEKGKELFVEEKKDKPVKKKRKPKELEVINPQVIDPPEKKIDKNIDKKLGENKVDDVGKKQENVKIENIVNQIIANEAQALKQGEGTNKVRGRYAVSDSNHVWASDWTIGHANGIYILLIIDLSTRWVVASEIMDRQPSGGDIVNLLMTGIRELQVQPKIFHTDCGGAYMSKELKKYLEHKKIVHSHREGHEPSFDNQVIERLNKKLWGEIQMLNWIDTESSKRRLIKASKQDTKFLIKSVIEKMNREKPGNWEEGNPQELYERLSEQPRQYEIIAKKNSKEGEWVKQYQNFVLIQGQANDLAKTIEAEHSEFNSILEKVTETIRTHENLRDVDLTVLIERARSARSMMSQMMEFFRTSFTSLDKAQENTTRLLKEFEESNKFKDELLIQQEKNTGEELAGLRKEISQLRVNAEKKEMEKLRQKEKKKSRVKRPLKNSITFEDLKGVLEETRREGTKNSVAGCRDRVCIVILYILGIRVAEVKQITISHIYDYLDKKPFEIEVGKSTSPVKMQYVSSEESRNIIKKNVLNDLETVSGLYGRGAYLATLSREHLTRRINDYFKSYGKKVNKNLLSHSCRIAFVTRIVEKFGIEIARQMVGHVNISTTQGYSRSMMTPRYRAHVLNKVLQEDDSTRSEMDSFNIEEKAAMLVEELDRNENQ
jgi:site-specific recombinase XerD/transposase InsO family protein